MNNFLNALIFNAGYNTNLVTFGATLLGFSAGISGTFLFLRKRALVCDAIAHATLPGIGLAFITMVLLGGDGRNLAGLLTGSIVTASLGTATISWIVHITRLTEDAAIGAVLSVFFGFGIVLLTIIQSMAIGYQAGLEHFFLGATAGMLFQDAIIISLGGVLTVATILLLRRPMMLVAFDINYAYTRGYNVQLVDFTIMALVLAVTAISLKIVGLILIVAMLIIPAVTARFWTERSDHILWIASGIGAVSSYIGTALSASVSALPTGPVIVIVCTSMFIFSLFLAPARGIIVVMYNNWQFQKRVHLRQGLLALASSEVIRDALTLKLLRRAKCLRKDGVATSTGIIKAQQAVLDERRWKIALRIFEKYNLKSHYYRLTPIDVVFTSEEIAKIDSILTELPTTSIDNSIT